jgi:hypothetical protein
MSNAFKEWSLICDVLGDGRQSILLRKGGIAEGRAGFFWKEPEFYLFPTFFHEQAAMVRMENAVAPPQPAGSGGNGPQTHTISLHAKVEFTALLQDWEAAQALAPWHFWKEEVVRQRFDYTGQRSIALAFVRVFRLAQPLAFADAPPYGGCRSWISIPAPEQPPAEMTAVLGEAEHTARGREIKSLLRLP